MSDQQPDRIDIGAHVQEIAKLCVERGADPTDVANALGAGMGMFMAEHFSRPVTAAILRQQAGEIDKPDRSQWPAEMRQAIDLSDQASAWIDFQIMAGAEEKLAVTAMADACRRRVAKKTGGALAAAAWLSALAAATVRNAAQIDEANRWA